MGMLFTQLFSSKNILPLWDVGFTFPYIMVDVKPCSSHIPFGRCVPNTHSKTGHIPLGWVFRCLFKAQQPNEQQKGG